MLNRIRFSSDKGAQYTSRLLAQWAHDNNVRLSCSRTGNRYDNAVAESFFAKLKNEMYYRTSFATRAQAKMAVIEFIETYYNRKRPHSTIGYQIPAEVMEAFLSVRHQRSLLYRKQLKFSNFCVRNLDTGQSSSVQTKPFKMTICQE